ncbi:MAG: SDR family oxidoreductase [Actinobacteria bacterium]|nr:SDR family oxidoreductase [Actinomycetota bacterium]
MSASLAGRVALVTGAAGAGIGKACARRLGRDGATVVVTDVHEARTDATTRELATELASTRVLGFSLDVTDRARVDAVLTEIADSVGPVDILVNNAAINVLGPVATYDPGDWDHVLEVDLTACWYLMRAVLPAMTAAGRGSIVNISSVASALGGGGTEGPYAAAKAGLESLTRTVAVEAGPHGVRANAVAVGIVRSKFVEKHAEQLAPSAARGPLRRMGEPEEIAAVVAWLASDESSFVTGETINASGGWHLSG